MKKIIVMCVVSMLLFSVVSILIAEHVVYAQEEGELETAPTFACETDVVKWVQRNEQATIDWMKDNLMQAQLDAFEANCFPHYHGLEIGPYRWEENRESLVNTYGEDHATVQALDAQVALMIASQTQED